MLPENWTNCLKSCKCHLGFWFTVANHDKRADADEQNHSVLCLCKHNPATSLLCGLPLISGPYTSAYAFLFPFFPLPPDFAHTNTEAFLFCFVPKTLHVSILFHFYPSSCVFLLSDSRLKVVLSAVWITLMRRLWFATQTEPVSPCTQNWIIWMIFFFVYYTQIN